MRITDIAHLCLAPVLRSGDWAIDATVGNGRDTLFLAERVGPDGRVFGFDIQAGALSAAQRRLGMRENVTLLHASHADMLRQLPADAAGRIAAIMFNLGYLPGGDKTVITTAATTIAALDVSLALLRGGGRLSAVVYPGHDGGAAETVAVRHFMSTRPAAYAVFHAERLTTASGAPEVFIVERLR